MKPLIDKAEKKYFRDHSHFQQPQPMASYVQSSEARKIVTQINQADLDTFTYFKKMKKAHHLYPDEIHIEVYMWALYGDYGQCLSVKNEEKYKTESSEALRKILMRLKGKHPIIRFVARNEYYYHSAKYLKQFKLGMERLAAGYNGHFSAGVGAAMHAFELLKCGQISRSLWYGQRALLHWNTYPESKRRSIGSYFYTLSLAFAGHPSKAANEFKKIQKSDRYGSTAHKGYYERHKADFKFIENELLKHQHLGGLKV